MVTEAPEVLYTNFTYNPEVYYFLYVGDLKNYNLNFFVREVLEKNVPNRRVQFVAVVPDVCIQYNFSNIIVINPVAHQEMLSDHRLSEVITPPKMSCRLSSAQFMEAVSKSTYIAQLIEQILASQNQLYVNLYESVVDLTLDLHDRVSILGPDKYIAHQFNNKVYQRQMLESTVPIVEGGICNGLSELLSSAEKLFEKWRDGLFVSTPYSAGGAASAVVHDREEILEKFKDQESTFMVTRYIPHKLDPTVLAVVANEKEVYIAGIADQVIVDRNRFVGSTFPSMTDGRQKTRLHHYTKKVGEVLGKAGYRGIFGCDYLIDHEDNIYFVEINARKQGTTLEFCYTLEQSLPEGSPSLPELEYYAVTQNRFPAHVKEMNGNHRGIHWGTHNYKITSKKLTTGYIPQNPYERETFRKIAGKELLKDFLILEHIGTNFMVSPGTFLARVVSVARNMDDVKEGLCQGVGFIQQTVREA